MLVVPEFETKKAMKLAMREYGIKGNLMSIGADAKTVKGEKLDFKTGIVYMQPSDRICPASKAAGCAESCLNTAGRAVIFNSIQEARKAKSKLFECNPALFLAGIISEIELKSRKLGQNFVVRLNGTSDIKWESLAFSFKGKQFNNIFELFPNVQFYDYTKIIKRAYDKLPENYDLTLSFSSSRESYARSVLKAARETGKRVAVVFRKHKPESWHGMRVIDGDDTDLRFLDDGAVCVALKAKGKAKKDNSGFVQDIAGGTIALA